MADRRRRQVTAREAGKALATPPPPPHKDSTGYEYEDHPWDDPALHPESERPKPKPTPPPRAPRPEPTPLPMANDAVALAEEQERRRKQVRMLTSPISDSIPGQKKQ